MFSVDQQEPVDPKTMPQAQLVNPDAPEKGSDLVLHRHSVLMQCLRDEADLQAEERLQMAIDHDYQDHLHWRPEDAAELIARGQAPLVFNEGRQSVEWICGMQKRMRVDGKILPREPGDAQNAEVKTQVFKYVSDTNLSQWHESEAFRHAAIGGLGWLEEGVNYEPDKPIIYSGHEDWRNVYRDSKDLTFDLDDSRYNFRKKRTDLDYAIALLPHARGHLVQQAGHFADDRRGDDIWYLGERLTGATDMAGDLYLPARFRDRSGYIGGTQRLNTGTRLSTDLIEAWYRVPESVQVFRNGPMAGKEFNPKNEGHVQLQTDRWAMYRTVVKRMRVMVCTESAPLWDGKSPFKHNRFQLVPVWGYRRGRDGMCYGLWRGMRDINDDINKRASKALHAASSNRVTAEKGSVEDPEKARREAARPDMWLEVKRLEGVRFEKPVADMQMNLDLMAMDREMLRNAGGVTDANLGRDSKAQSGKAIGLVQDQGSLVTSELPDKLRLARQMAGRLRLSHIEQFMTEQQVIRITGDSKPTQWVTINEQQPDGSILNDIASKEADYIISERDYRESYAQAALAQMMEMLGQIAQYAPNVVLAVLDLVVDTMDIKGKDEWVARIREINGQRDPTKEPTPEELAAKQAQQAKQQRLEQLNIDTLQAQLDKLRAEVSKLDVDGILKRVESLFSALQAAQIVAVTPGVAPVADTIAKGAGFKDQAGDDPNLPKLAAPAAAQAAVEPAPPGGAPLPNVEQPPPAAAASATGLQGMQSGINTPTPADNGPAI